MSSGMLLRIWPRKSQETKLHIPMRILKTIGFLRLHEFCSLVINNFSGYNNVLMKRTLPSIYIHISLVKLNVEVFSDSGYMSWCCSSVFVALDVVSNSGIAVALVGYRALFRYPVAIPSVSHRYPIRAAGSAFGSPLLSHWNPVGGGIPS